MKSIVLLSAALLAVAGPAAAEFGKPAGPSGFQKPKPVPGISPTVPNYGVPLPPSAAKPKSYIAPLAAEPFKPFEPYKPKTGTSLFGPDRKPKR